MIVLFMNLDKILTLAPIYSKIVSDGKVQKNYSDAETYWQGNDDNAMQCNFDTNAQGRVDRANRKKSIGWNSSGEAG